MEQAVTTPGQDVLGRTGAFDVATSGETIVVVSTDSRTDRGSEIVITRLERTGFVRDSFALTTTPGIDETNPMIVYDEPEERYVVVWESNGTTMAASLDRAGEVIIGPTVIAPGTPSSLMPDDRSPLLLSIANRDGTTIYRVRNDLGVAELTEVLRRRNTETVRLGNGLLMLSVENDFPHDRRIVRATRLDDRLRVASNATVEQLGTFLTAPSLILENVGDDAIAAAASADRLVVARFANDGTVTLLHVDESDTSRSVEDIVVRSDGFDLLMIIDGRGRVLRFTGNVLDDSTTPVAGTATDAGGVRGRNGILTFWLREGAIVARHAFAGNTELSTTITRGPSSQQMPQLATDGSNVLAVWLEDATDTTDRVMARVLTTTGAPVGSAITLATRSMTPASSPPAVTFTGGEYIVAWIDQRRGPDRPAIVTFSRVDPTGQVIDDETVSLSADLTDRVALAGDGIDALLVWAERPLTDSELRAALISQPAREFEIPDVASEPAVVYGNGNYLVAGTTTGGSIRGTLVSRSGAVVRTAFETTGPKDSKAALAWNGRSRYLLVFRRDGSLTGRLLDAEAAPIGSDFAIAPGMLADNPRVAWDGHAFVVSWTSRTSANALSDGDVYGARVRATGEADAPVAISVTERNDDFPTLLGLGAGMTLAAYQRMMPEFQNVHRIFTRVITTPPIATKRRAVR